MICLETISQNGISFRNFKNNMFNRQIFFFWKKNNNNNIKKKKDDNDDNKQRIISSNDYISNIFILVYKFSHVSFYYLKFCFIIVSNFSSGSYVVWTNLNKKNVVWFLWELDKFK